MTEKKACRCTKTWGTNTQYTETFFLVHDATNSPSRFCPPPPPPCGGHRISSAAFFSRRRRTCRSPSWSEHAFCRPRSARFSARRSPAPLRCANLASPSPFFGRALVHEL